MGIYTYIMYIQLGDCVIVISLSIKRNIKPILSTFFHILYYRKVPSTAGQLIYISRSHARASLQ